MNLGTKELAERQAEFCKLFGNASRIMIMWCLSEHELSVNEIADQVGTSLQNISQHLSILKEKHIVSARRDGQTIYYHISGNEKVQECPALFIPPNTNQLKKIFRNPKEVPNDYP